jgi:hypothetical protein
MTLPHSMQAAFINRYGKSEVIEVGAHDRSRSWRVRGKLVIRVG